MGNGGGFCSSPTAATSAAAECATAYSRGGSASAATSDAATSAGPSIRTSSAHTRDSTSTPRATTWLLQLKGIECCLRKCPIPNTTGGRKPLHPSMHLLISLKTGQVT